MNRGPLQLETLGKLDESVFRLVEINPETETHVNNQLESIFPVPDIPRNGKYTYSQFENLVVVESKDSVRRSVFEIYRSSPDIWYINDNGNESSWTRRPNEPFLVGSAKRHSESVIGEELGQRLLGILDILIHINEPRNY